MKPDSSRWHTVSDSEFAHEREGLALVQDLLPDRAPFHAWSNFEFRGSQGPWYEVDLLVFGEGRLHLVELKHYQGAIGGTAAVWQRGPRSEDSPLLLARKKAQRLKSVLVDAATQLGLAPRLIPFVQECVFLHAERFQSTLSAADSRDLFSVDGREDQTGLPGLSDRLLEPDRRLGGQRLSEAQLLAIVEKAGFAVRREREVGSWRLAGQVLGEGEGWQDWPAEHRVTSERARIRFFTTPRGAGKAEIGAVRKLTEREYALTSRLHHEGILSPKDIVEDELGSGLVFPYDPDDQRLDLWLTDTATTLDLRGQIELVRQLSEAIQYAHGNGVVHRRLTPAAVAVHSSTHGGPALRIGDWQVAGAANGASVLETQGIATRIFERIDQLRPNVDLPQAEVYSAPEGQWSADANRVKLDVFALGALTSLIVTGHDPATSAIELQQRLGREHGIDLAAELPQVSASLRSLVLAATTPVVSERVRDVSAFLERLSEVERELGATDVGSPIDPLDAPPGTNFGDRFTLVRRLGSGSTAVGLLVRDSESGDDYRVLKMALDDSAAKRLDGEAEVLTTLTEQRAPRVVRIRVPTPIEVGGRRALVLDFAGDETLAEVLRDRRRLSLDLLERWGVDLLEALVALDAAGVDHRDIKPANLGVREQRTDRAKHLVLFDFSLAKASASTLSAGTPPYLDPFLGTGIRMHWDSAAERYAAAVTLFEMATGHAPVYGDGETAPQFVERATIEPGDFDPTVADVLTAFFRRALAKDAKQRHGTAADMLLDWRTALAPSASATPGDVDDLADAAALDTPLAQAGLTPRALSALEPFRVQTVGDLAAVDPGRLSRLVGVVDATKREIRSRAKQWRERFADQLVPARVGDAANEENPFTQPDRTALALADAAGLRAPARRTAAEVLLGLSGDIQAFATLSELAPALGLGGQPQVSMTLAGLRDAWARNAEAASLLDKVFDQIVAALHGLDGASWTDSLVQTLAPSTADARYRRLVAGLVRAALDRADDKAKGAGEEPLIARRRARRDGRVLLGTSPAVADVAALLGARAAELVVAATAAGEIVVPRGRSIPTLRTVWSADLPVLDDLRLIRLAGRLADTAASSANGELYSTTMDVTDAVRLAIGSTTPSQRFSPQELQRLVQVRFPGVPPVPGRPGLDRTLAEAGTELAWDGDAFAVPSAHSDTTFVTRLTVPAVSVSVIGSDEHPWLARLRESVHARSFLALGVPARHTARITEQLAAMFGAAEVNVTDVLLDALRTSAEEHGIPWDTVLAADAAAASTQDARGLAALVQQSVPAVEAALQQALQSAALGSRPVMLSEAAPLARYGQMGLISRLADIATPRQQAVWLIVPEQHAGEHLLDGTPVPLTYASQFVPLDAALEPREGATP